MVDKRTFLLIGILIFSLTSVSAISWSGGAIAANPFDQDLNTTDDVTFNNVTSTNFFNGLFNWIINLGDGSTAYLTFNGSTLSFNETKLNATIQNLSGGGGGGGATGLWTTNGTNIFNQSVSQVGIATANPDSTLTVNGTINVTNNLNNISIYFESGHLVVEG